MAVHPLPEYRTSQGRGRPTTDDVEARSGTGRWLHQLEGRVFGIAAACVRGRDARPLWEQHDAQTDRAVLAAEMIARKLIDHGDPAVRAHALEMVGYCADYHKADEREDACTVGVFGTLAEIHETARRIAAWVERSCTALRGKR